MNGFGIPKDIWKLIIDYLPELFKRVLRCTCWYFRNLIVVDKSSYFRHFILEQIVGYDYAKLIKWFLQNTNRVSEIEFCANISLIHRYGSIECLKLYATINNKLDINKIWQLQDDDNGLRMLQFYHPIIFKSIKNRFITFGWLKNNRQKLMPYLLDNGIITQSIIDDIEENGFNFDITKVVEIFIMTEFLIELFEIVEFSYTFIDMIIKILFRNKSYMQIIRIMNKFAIHNEKYCSRIPKEYLDYIEKDLVIKKRKL